MAALMAIGIGLMLIGQALQSHTRLQRSHDAHRAVDELLRASVSLARERGLTALVLGGGSAAETLRDLARLRSGAEAGWRDVQESVERVRRSVANPQSLEQAQQRVLQTHAQLGVARARVDLGLEIGSAGVDAQEWWRVTTEHNLACAQLRDQLLSADFLDTEGIGLNLMLVRMAWDLGEVIGQIRGAVAFHAANRSPLGEMTLAQIDLARSRIRALLGQWAELHDLPGLSGDLRDAMDTAGQLLGSSFDQVLDRMLARADSGDYPIDAGQWYAQTTRQIDAVTGFSGMVAARETAQLQAQLHRSQWSLAAFVLFVLVGALLAARSIRRIRRVADHLFLHKELAEITLHSIGDAVITTDEKGRIRYLNPVAEGLTGWITVEARGKPATEIFRVENTVHASVVDPVGSCLEQGKVVGLDTGHVLIARDGSRISIEDSAAPIRARDARVIGCVVVFYDTRKPRNNEHLLLSFHATRDPLTGLINRREFDRRLQELLRTTKTDDGQHVLAYIDLDQFKIVNDTCGHSAGDQMLRQVSFLMRKKIRDGDLFARLGGDEFAVLLYNCPLEKGVSLLDALCRDLRDFRFTWKDKPFSISLSIGVVPVTAASGSTDELLSTADAACYAAKEKGRNRLQVYEADDAELFERQGEMQWLPRITKALEEDRFLLYCQRMQPLQPGLPPRIEILLRKRSIEGELIAPMAFIPAAERYQLMPQIDRWVIREVCAQMGRFLAANPETIVNLNLSGLTLGEERIEEFILETVCSAGITPARLCFEITETAAIANMDVALDVMHRICAHGFTFSLDDFGIGLSSFAYLKTLPVAQIKIGDNYVRKMLTDPLSLAVVRAAIGIGQVLDIAVCAECVETRETLDALREMGVGHAQGHVIHHPQPLAEYAD